jgi:hypothetical protein
MAQTQAGKDNGNFGRHYFMCKAGLPQCRSCFEWADGLGNMADKPVGYAAALTVTGRKRKAEELTDPPSQPPHKLRAMESKYVPCVDVSDGFVLVYKSYDIKDWLKAAGFRFSKPNKAWFRHEADFRHDVALQRNGGTAPFKNKITMNIVRELCGFTTAEQKAKKQASREASYAHFNNQAYGGGGGGGYGYGGYAGYAAM